MSEKIDRVKLAIRKALEMSDSQAYIVETGVDGKTIIDGSFNLDSVARAAIDAIDTAATGASGDKGGASVPQTRYLVIRKASLMEDEGRDQLIGEFATEADAAARIAQLSRDGYFRAGDFTIVKSTEE